jgi:hypothetical protein
MEMKCFSLILYFAILHILIPQTSQVIIKKTNKVQDIEKIFQNTKLKESVPRQLGGEGEEGGNTSMFEYNLKVIQYACEVAQSLLPSLEVGKDSCHYNGHQDAKVVTMTSKIVESGEGDEKVQTSNVSIISPIGTMDMNVEMVNNFELVKPKIEFLLQINFVKLSQLLFTTAEVTSLFDQWAELNFKPYSSQASSEEKEARKLEVLETTKISKKAREKLLNKPRVLGGIVDKRIPINNKKGVQLSQATKDTMRELRENIDERLNKVRNMPRKLEDLDPSDLKHMFDRTGTFTNNEMDNRSETLFSLVGGGTDLGGFTEYIILPSKRRIAPIRLLIGMTDNGMIILHFKGASFNISCTIGIPTKRFYIKMLDIQKKIMRKICDVIGSLDMLEYWQNKDQSLNHNRRQRIDINFYQPPIMQSRIKYDLIEKVNNSLPIGDYKVGDIAHSYYKLSVFTNPDNNNDEWQCDVKDSTGNMILHNSQSFKSYGVNTSLAQDIASVYLNGFQLKLGTRYYLDNSMFNQNLMASLYADFMTSVALRVTEVVNSDPIYDFASPFAITNFTYSKKFDSGSSVGFSLNNLYQNEGRVEDVGIVEEGVYYQFDTCKVKKDHVVFSQAHGVDFGVHRIHQEVNGYTLELCSKETDQKPIGADGEQVKDEARLLEAIQQVNRIAQRRSNLLV